MDPETMYCPVFTHHTWFWLLLIWYFCYSYLKWSVLQAAYTCSGMYYRRLILVVACITGGSYLYWYVLQEAYTCTGMYYRRLILVLVCITGGHTIAIRTHDGPRNHVFPYDYTPYFYYRRLILVVVYMHYRWFILVHACIIGGHVIRNHGDLKTMYSPMFTHHIYLALIIVMRGSPP